MGEVSSQMEEKMAEELSTRVSNAEAVDSGEIKCNANANSEEKKRKVHAGKLERNR